MADEPHNESEWKTRRERIDPRLKASGWTIVRFDESRPLGDAQVIAEYPTSNGPADYALCLDGRLVGVVEAKRLTIGAQGVLPQAERYSRGITDGAFDFRGLRVPFLYSTNGEKIRFHDARHALSLSHWVAGFHTPAALRELLGYDHQERCRWFVATPNNHEKLRPYQREANAAVEKAIGECKRQMLVAMATGTGKTFTTVNQVYRLLKSGVARRVLFLVDRRALAAQAVRAFASFEPEPGLKFDRIYEVFSQRFQREDFGAEEHSDPNVLPRDYLLDPGPQHTFVYVCTIQRMAINLFGRQAVFDLGDDETADDDAERLEIPIHAFDVIIADECHRGYTTSARSSHAGSDASLAYRTNAKSTCRP
jgi:type I restriction enzyme R subunit